MNPQESAALAAWVAALGGALFGLSGLVVGLMGLVYSRRAIASAAGANLIAKDANKIATAANATSRDANEISRGANEIAEAANSTADEATRLSAEANEIAREANDLAKFSSMQGFEQHDVTWSWRWLTGFLLAFKNEGRDMAHDVSVRVTADGESVTSTREWVMGGEEVVVALPDTFHRRLAENVSVRFLWRTDLGTPKEHDATFGGPGE